MSKIRSTVLGLVLAVAALGCDQPGAGSPSGNVAEVSASLTTVPSGVLCVKLALSGAASSSLMLTVTSGASSASLSLGYVPAGNLTVTPSAFNVACSSVTSSTVPNWAGPAVTVTVVAGVPLAVPLTLEPYSATATVNFVPFVKAVSAGNYSSYALSSDGTVRAWGSNYVGQLGDGTIVNRSTPVAVSGLSGVASLAAGSSGYHSCAVKANGSVSCWGSNASGQIGNGTTSAYVTTPVSVVGGNLFVQVAAGGDFTCGVTTGGAVSCWGDNSSGAFGNGTVASSLTPTAPASPLSGAVQEVQVNYSCACLRGGIGQLVCAGQNNYGAFGTGDESNYTSWTPNSLQTFAALPAGLAVGYGHACSIVLADGSVRCTGYNAWGQLGDGTYTTRLSAVPVIGLTGVTALAAANVSTCALKSDGTVWCWGYNYDGELGDATFNLRAVPAPVSGLSGAVAIAAGTFHTCAAKSDGSVWCWGLNISGQLGDGTTVSRAVPVKVAF